MISRNERVLDQGHRSSEPLIQDGVLIAEILSYVLTTTKGFARLRQVCKSWKNEILPYFLEHHSHHYPAREFASDHHQQQNFFFLRICTDNGDEISTLPAHQTNIPYRQSLPQVSRSPKFLSELVHLAYHHRFAGRRFDDLDVWKSIWGLPTLDFWESVTNSHDVPYHHPILRENAPPPSQVEISNMLPQGYQAQLELQVGHQTSGDDDISAQSLLIVREAVPSIHRITPQRVVDQVTSVDYFASLCQALVETDSWPQFCTLGEEALNEGMFLSMADHETMIETVKDEGSFAFESRIVPVIFTVRFRLPPPIGSQDAQPLPRQVCFQVRVPKPTLEDNDDDFIQHGVANGNETDLQGPRMEIVREDDGADVQNPPMAPFVKYLPLHNDGNDDAPGQIYARARFMGYNVQPAVGMEDGIHVNEELAGIEDEHYDGTIRRPQYYTCHLPMSFAWWELMQLLVPEGGGGGSIGSDGSSENLDGCHHHGLEDQGADSFLPVDWLRTTCEGRSVQEGVGIMDGLLDYDRHMQLAEQLDALASDLAVSATANPLVPEFSFRQWQERQRQEEPTTHHMTGRKALVDPDLYCYSERHSVLNRSVLDVPPCSFPDSYLDSPILQTVNYWGRSYTASIEYQWLPTYFDVDPDGKRTTIRDYINNLVPRQRYEELYDSLSQLFSLALPLLESVFSYCRVIKRSHVRMVESTHQTWHPLPPSPLKEEPTLLRGQSLQVITEIEEYELNESSSSVQEEDWHVKGMPHEEIVATAMYILPMTENQHQLGSSSSVGTIRFQRAFFNDEANYLFSAIDRDRPPEVEAEVHTGLLPLGQADLIPGRLLVFPNYHVSKRCLRIHPHSNKADCKLRLIMFHLVNPEKRITSTREVETQQDTLNGTISPEQARMHRIELQRERENGTPDWNVREIHLL